MNLAEKIKQEREQKASQEAIKTAEKNAKLAEIKEQLENISNITLAEWFLKEVEIGGKCAYDKLVDNDPVQFELKRLYIDKKNIESTKIASLIYNSNTKDNYVERNSNYAGGTFRKCLAKKAVERILLGLEEMNFSITTKIITPHCVIEEPYDVTVIELKEGK